MRLTLKILIVLMLIPSLSLKASYADEFKPVVKIFSGFSLFEHDLIKQSVTDDFLLLEQGEVWDTKILLSHIQPADFVRKNHFSIISSHVVGDAVLINYWNKAVFIEDDIEETVVWLESVVSVKSNDDWKLQQMHSTRVELENVPKDVEFKELSYKQ